MAAVADPSTASTGLIDLEKELTCSICTEVLYQPLTLLDCLHTFCGSCLKEWFGWQRVNADKEWERAHRGDGHARRRRRRPYVYTCPSCRAVVRETRPNATVTTLLDMYLKANPGRDKNADEKDEIKTHYTPGEVVLVKPEEEEEEQAQAGAQEGNRDASREEEEDRRLLEHVRDMSMRDMGSGHAGETRRTRPQSPPASRQSHEGSSRQRNGHQSNRNSRANGLGHQSSLRSLLSNSYDSEEMKSEILRQIAEEGLLDDIDWDNIRDEQEDEISERIADAYRRRRRNTSRRPHATPREEVARRDRSREPRRSGETPRPSRRTTENVAGSGRAVDSRPPTSFPNAHAQEHTNARPRNSHRHQRSSSQDHDVHSRQASDTSRQAGRSATDLSDTSTNHRPDRRRRASHGNRSSTDPGGVSFSEQWRRGRPRQSPTTSSANVDVAAANVATPPAVQSPRSVASPPQAHNITVACDRCGRENIERRLHYSCPDCRPDASTYDLCVWCYRSGKGCEHWFGFGHAAWPKYKRLGSPGDPPHVLRSQKYIPSGDAPEDEQGRRDLGLQPITQGDLVLQRGVFCDHCQQNANMCYWHCDACNDGEWGFCNGCVNEARHCTHPLLPLALETAATGTLSSQATDQLHPLDLPCTCNMCHQAIEPSAQRLHCPTCESGNYDVCMPCYRSLVNSGRIKATDGLHGWRRCLSGHRMLLVQFTQHDNGPWWRTVLDGPVGGWALDEAATSTGGSEQQRQHWSWTSPDGQRAFKADGRGRRDSASPADAQPGAAGNAARSVALWSWVPDEGVADELAFPKGAVVAECVDINGEFGWGVYCRAGGLFPSAYVRSVD